MAIALAVPCISRAQIHPLRGNIELGYYSLKSSENGSVVTDNDIFYQRYSIATGVSGNIYNKRSGPYRLDVIYNYADYKSNTIGKSYHADAGYFDWNGRMDLNFFHLKGLRVSLYAMRTTSEVLEADVTSATAQVGGYGLSDKIVSEIEQAPYYSHGLNATLGNNGGPRYYLSYVADTYEPTTGKIKQEEARFSMSKGVNWLHLYRGERLDADPAATMTVYTIRLGNVGMANYSRKSVLGRGLSGGMGKRFALSSIMTPGASPATEDRFWYRLTNWLNVSTDIMHSKIDMQTGERNYDAMNFLVIGERSWWNLYARTGYIRRQGDSEDNRVFYLPLHLDFTSTQFTEYRLSHQYRVEKTEDESLMTESEESLLSESFWSIWRPRGWLKLETEYDFDNTSDDSREVRAHSFRIQGFTRREKRFDYGFTYGYNNTATDDFATGETDQNSHLANFQGSYRFGNNAVFAASQSFTISKATAASNETSTKSYTTSISYKYSIARAAFDLRAQRSTRDEDQSKEVRDDIRAKMDFRFDRRMHGHMRFSTAKTSKSGLISEETRQDEVLADIDFKASRAVESKTSIAYTNNAVDGFDRSDEYFVETLYYTHYKRGRRARALFNIRGEFQYRKTGSDSSGQDSQTYLTEFQYYPSRTLTCGVVYEKRASDTTRNQMMLYTSLNYPLLRISGRYYHKENGHSGVDVEEDRLYIDVNKRF